MKFLLSLLLALTGAKIACGSDIAVVTLAAGSAYQAIVRCGLDSKKAYCQKRGYDFVCGEESLDLSRPFAWSKIMLLLKTMENSSYKWLFWTEANSMITNMAIRLEDLIDDGYFLIMGKGLNGESCGHFLIKNCKEAREFLERVYSHTEGLPHPQAEEKAILLELERDKNLQHSLKVIPQRFINSYPLEICAKKAPQVTFQTGDFVVYFHGVKDKSELQKLFNCYSQQVVEDVKAITLDSYLEAYGFTLSEIHKDGKRSYLTSEEKNQFNERLKSYLEIHSIALIGFQSGHSADNFIRNCPHLERIVCFDQGAFAYSMVSSEYFTRFYPKLFYFATGDPFLTMSQYLEKEPTSAFDLIYIDLALTDVKRAVEQAIRFAHLNSYLWINGENRELYDFLTKLASEKKIELIATHFSRDSGGVRRWIEARVITDHHQKYTSLP